MRGIGIIGEYNPFHSGHEFLISSAKEIASSDAVVSIMSGNFTQRGTPAVFDKWKRAESAVRGGVNLVLELPQAFTLTGAGDFAEAGVRILDALKICDHIAFGSESGDKTGLNSISDALIEMEESDSSIKAFLKEGMSFPSAREKALKSLYPNLDLSIASSPNDILGIEYLKALKKTNSHIEPIVVKRNGEGHYESATSIREKLKRDDSERERLESMETSYYDLVRAAILSLSLEELDDLASSESGLGNKLKNEVRYAKSLDDLIKRIKSKRYTYTRINRLLTQALIGVKKSHLLQKVNEKGLYIRALAFDKKGAELLRLIHDSNPRLPLIESPARVKNYAELNEIMDINIQATDVYNILNNRDLYENSDYVRRGFLI